MRDVLEIDTERLVLRRPAASDATRVACFLADQGVSRMVASVPHPYPPSAAEGWLMLQRARRGLGDDHVFAIELPREGLIGMVGAHAAGDVFEIGYWIGRPYWGEGFATEALQGFVVEAKRLGELEAGHFVDNPASGRVLERAGFVYTGEIAARFSLARGERVPSRRMRYKPKPARRGAAMEACC
ncbi:MAG TPA: GNAT family N-acetyltransferase [Caulobacterales bacterium]|nr:GNAT family N-acetyltransferase [Caulobacterales bacterium]